MSTRKIQFRGQLQRIGQPPEPVDLVVDEVNPAIQFKIKTVDQDVISSTVLVDDGELTEFITKANSWYVFESHIAYTQNVGDFKFDLSFGGNLPVAANDSVTFWITDSLGGQSKRS